MGQQSNEPRAKLQSGDGQRRVPAPPAELDVDRGWCGASTATSPARIIDSAQQPGSDSRRERPGTSASAKLDVDRGWFGASTATSPEQHRKLRYRLNNPSKRNEEGGIRFPLPFLSCNIALPRF